MIESIPEPITFATVPIGPGNKGLIPLITFGAILNTPFIFPPIHLAALWRPVFIFFQVFEAYTATTYAFSIYVNTPGKKYITFT